MPRTRKYDVNESIASSQATIITRVNDNNVHEHESHLGAPVSQKKNSLQIGWCMGATIGALCLAFIFCVAFIKVPGVPTERANPSSDRHTLRKQGYFQIYPVPSNDGESSFQKAQVISLADMRSPIEQLRKEINGYPEYTDSYTTCFVSVPTFNRPCFFEKVWLGMTCTEENDFGYKEVDGMINPCILLRLENLTDWQPLVYRSADVDESWIEFYDPTFSSLECRIPDRHEDKLKSISIYPEKGFANQFFPVSGFNESLYLKPSVMLQINGLSVGQSITFQCWLRISNAYMLEDDGEIIINISSANATNDVTTSNSPSTTSPIVQNGSTSTMPSTIENITETTTIRRLLSTTPGFNLGGNN